MLQSSFSYPPHDKVFKRLDYWWRDMSDAYLSALPYGGSMAAYQEAKEIYAKVVLYENLCEFPRDEISSILGLLGKYSGENVNLALSAFETDSQDGVFKNTKNFHLTDKEWEKANKIFEDLGLNMRGDMSMDEFREWFSTP